MSRPAPDRSPTGLPGRNLLPVGRFFGVPLYFAPSWLLIAALITFTYGGFVHDAVPCVGDGTATLVALGYAVALAVCMLLHELGHTAVSLALHRPVRRVVIFLLGGVSEIEGELPRARDEFLVAAAGPLVSLLLGGGAALAAQAVPDATIGWVLLALLAWSNLLVAVFNLLPGLPLDGGRVLRAAVWGVSRSRRRGTVAAEWGGRAVAVLVGGTALVLGSGSAGATNAVVGVMLAVFIWLGATQALRAAAVEARLPSLSARALVRAGLMVASETSVAEALRRAWAARAQGLLVVDSADRPRALVDEGQVRAVPEERRAWTPVGELARPLEDGLVLSIELAGPELLEAVSRTPATEYLVVAHDGSPAGIITAADVMAALSGTGPARSAPPVPAGPGR